MIVLFSLSKETTSLYSSVFVPSVNLTRFPKFTFSRTVELTVITVSPTVTFAPIAPIIVSGEIQNRALSVPVVNPEILSKYLCEQVLFLDNQWVDETSLKITTKIVTENVNQKVFIWSKDITEKDVNEYIIKQDWARRLQSPVDVESTHAKHQSPTEQSQKRIEERLRQLADRSWAENARRW